MSDKIKKLNLGSGEDRKEGYINIDWNKISNPDIVHDLNKFPYPFEDNSFDLIEATHIIEHLDRPFEIMREMHRILKKGGRLKIKVPHFSRGMTHSEHLHGFDVTFPMYFNKKYADMGFSGYYGVDFELIGLKLKWMAFIRMLPSMGYSKITIILVSFLNKFLSFLANLSPNICSRVWCFWVGGFEEIEFVFKK